MEPKDINFDFIGKGWSFPPIFNKTTKGVEQREGNDDIIESLNILLTTLPGERIYDSNFGCDLSPLLFEPFTNTLKSSLSDRIKNAIVLFEARIVVENIIFRLSSEEGIIYISINYLIKSHNSRYNMVFPYYLKEGTEL
jgi:phage baseplate assembly protein W